MLEAEVLPEAVNQAVTIVPVDTMVDVIRHAAPDLRTYSLEWASHPAGSLAVHCGLILHSYILYEAPYILLHLNILLSPSNGR